MTDKEPDNSPDKDRDGVKEGVPVMFCQTADGGWSKPLARGSTPSTPRYMRSEKRRLSALMFFRCTPEERTTIAANAATVGMELSSYMRMQSIGKPLMRAYRRVRVDWQILQRCMGVINKAGNVVNQLVVELRRMGGNPNLADKQGDKQVINPGRMAGKTKIQSREFYNGAFEDADAPEPARKKKGDSDGKSDGSGGGMGSILSAFKTASHHHTAWHGEHHNKASSKANGPNRRHKNVWVPVERRQRRPKDNPPPAPTPKPGS